LISQRLPRKLLGAVDAARRISGAPDKVLNRRADSICPTALDFLATAQNKFINRLPLRAAHPSFASARPRYANK
jgi:hypothetical protein